MELIYVFVVNAAEWEDIIIYLSEAEAIEKSRKNPNSRVEIFAKTADGYQPTYECFINGKLIK